jgi:predicted dithiol-disulfide oxidoreductase (DUF899 family)
MKANPIVCRDEWLVARKQLLRKEKELTRQRDELCRERRALPWVRVEKPYVFEGPDGKKTLAELFEDRSQLLVYHFMFGPGWKEGCVGCSFLVDHLGGPLLHLPQRDVKLVVVSRAPLAEIEAFQQRMGWRFEWVSSFGSEFNYDHHVSFTPEQLAKGKVECNYEMVEMQSEEISGTSVFYKDATGDVFHTYSCHGRGDEPLLGTYALLDLLPKGRDETGPHHNLTDWVRHHDRYGADGYVDSGGRYVDASER